MPSGGPGGYVTAAAKAKATKAPSQPLIPSGKRGTITFTQRDVPGRIGIAASAALGVAPTMGYVGGPDFPEDPNDLGPLVPLPGGWRELLEFLREAGSSRSSSPVTARTPPTPAARRRTRRQAVSRPPSRARPTWPTGTRSGGFLDEFDLEAIGNHGFIPNTWPGPSSSGGGMSVNDYERFQTELEFASILGMPYMGTGIPSRASCDRLRRHFWGRPARPRAHPRPCASRTPATVPPLSAAVRRDAARDPGRPGRGRRQALTTAPRPGRLSRAGGRARGP